MLTPRADKMHLAFSHQTKVDGVCKTRMDLLDRLAGSAAPSYPSKRMGKTPTDAKNTPCATTPTRSETNAALSGAN